MQRIWYEKDIYYLPNIYGLLHIPQPPCTVKAKVKHCPLECEQKGLCPF